jgi:hypothetical protein
VHDIDVGDDFLTSREIRLTPTLTVFAATGLSLATGDSDFRLVHKLDLSLTRVWQTATFAIGVRRGLTGSFGVSGPSFTTNFFSYFNTQLTRRLTGIASTSFSLFDTDDSDFKVFQVQVGMQYWVMSWLSANLAYNYSWLDPESSSADSSASSGFLRNAKTDSNSVFLSLAAYFDLWPNLSLARGVSSSLLFPFSPSGGGGTLPSPGPTPQP